MKTISLNTMKIIYCHRNEGDRAVYITLLSTKIPFEFQLKISNEGIQVSKLR